MKSYIVKITGSLNWSVSLTVYVCADVGLPAVSEQSMGVKEVRSMVQLTIRILAEPYSKWLCIEQDLT